MKIICIAIGSRGDIEPFVAMGEIFQNQGHEVISAFPEQFRPLAEDANLSFHSLGSEFLEMLHSPEGKIAMGGSGSGFKKIVATIKLAKRFSNISEELLKKQFNLFESEKPDRVIYHGKAIYGHIWGAINPKKAFISTPIPYLYHPVKGKSHLVFNSNYGSFLNKFTFKLADWGLMVSINKNLKRLNLHKTISKKQIKKHIKEANSIYTLSPSLFSRPNYWNDKVKLVGYLERNKVNNWKPTEELENFISKHEKILFITFGSMTNPEPEEKTNFILEILENHKIPAIINTASGGLRKPENFQSNLIQFVPRIPYDWVFPKMHAVIHHGGAGTTYLAIKYGCSSMIVPHIIDQHMWNKLIDERNLGPKGIKISKLSKSNLEPRLLDLFTNNSYKNEAIKIGAEMQKEDFENELIQFIES